MNFKNLKINIALGCVCITLAGCGGSYTSEVNLTTKAENFVKPRLVVSSNNQRYRDLVADSFKGDRDKNINDKYRVGVTSHHLPVAAEFVGDFYEYVKENTDSKTVIVIGPDHPEKCAGKINTALVSYNTGFGKLDVDEGLFEYLSGFEGINIEDKCLINEHSIGVQTDYIRMLWDEVKFAPITISSSLEDERVEQLADYLSKIEDAIFVVSVDFNHYRNVKDSQIYDLETKYVFESFDTTLLDVDNVDSPPSLKTAFKLAEILERKEAKILDYKNSYNFTGQENNTTSYFNISFE